MYQKELVAALEACRIANKIIIEIYNQNFEIEIKEDDSPVTIADKTADAAIRAYLAPLFPSYKFLTEEGVDDVSRLAADYVWIIDPLDGTKDFIHHDDEFSVCIALSYKGEIVVGVIGAPVSGDLYYATLNGGAFYLKADRSETKLQVSSKTSDITAVASRYHRRSNEDDYFTRNQDLISKVVTIGSTLKAMAIAKGEAELVFRGSAGTKEWDIAASDLIITEAGGLFLKPNGDKIKYNKQDVRNLDGYIIVNRKENIRL